MVSASWRVFKQMEGRVGNPGFGYTAPQVRSLALQNRLHTGLPTRKSKKRMLRASSHI